MPSCPDGRVCATLIALGYLVVHLEPGEPFGIIAFPNSMTASPIGTRWVATVGLDSGFEDDEIRAVAGDRGGVVV